MLKDDLPVAGGMQEKLVAMLIFSLSGILFSSLSSQ
jgi:hypothetical protein